MWPRREWWRIPGAPWHMWTQGYPRGLLCTPKPPYAHLIAARVGIKLVFKCTEPARTASEGLKLRVDARDRSVV